MSDPRSTVAGYVEPGAPRVGLWCASCALPSRIEFTVYLLAVDGGISSLGDLSLCTECGQ